MRKEKEEKKNKRKKNLFRIKEQLCKGKDSSFIDFINFLFEHGYFQDIPDTEIDSATDAIQSGKPLSLGLLKANGIGVGIVMEADSRTEQAFVGIDPTNCYDSTKRCSVYAYFPMKKREYQVFIRLFSRLNDEKDILRREWMQKASTEWYGSYAKFGE